MSFIKGRFQLAEESSFRPQLTSLIDVMTILLFFLIKSFSAEGDLVTAAKDLVLPVSSSEKAPQLRSTIEITRNAIISKGRTIITLDKLVESDSLIIASLYDWMRVVRSGNKDPQTASSLLIQCDRDVEFFIVKRVMFSCSKAGFTDFSVLVLQEEQ